MIAINDGDAAGAAEWRLHDPEATRMTPYALVLAAAIAASSAAPSDCPLHAEHAGGAPPVASVALTEPGQSAFAALAEVADALAADAATDWARVDLLRLREHLVDMEEVATRADVVERPIDGGVEATVRGDGRTLRALAAIVPAHAAMTDGRGGVDVAVEETAGGWVVRLRAADAAGAARVRALGFFGWLASGDHHRRHHLLLARGADPHAGGH